MGKTFARYAAVAVIALAGLLVSRVGFQALLRGAAQGSPGGLFIDPAQLDIGDQWSQHRFGWNLTVQNRTDKVISIRDFRVTCRCTTVEPAQLSIGAALRGAGQARTGPYGRSEATR